MAYAPVRPFWEEDEIDQPGPGARPTVQSGRFGRVNVGAPDPRRAADLTRTNQQNVAFPREQERQDNQDVRQGNADARAAEEHMRLPTSEADKLSTMVTAFSNLNRAVSGFQDDYSGFGSRIENFAQGYSPIPVGTEGQRNWWARFYDADNIARNALFGASLSQGEQAAWDRTTITPGMNPQEVRRNLDERMEIARGALRRRVGYLREGGYNQRQIDELVGADTMGALFGQQRPGADQQQRPEGNVLFNDEARPPEAQNPLNPEQQQRYDAWIRANPNATAEQLDSFFYGLTGTHLSNADAMVQSRDRPGGFMRPGADAVRQQERRPDISDARGQGGIGESADAFMRGAADIPTVGLADEIAAGLESLTNGGSYGENLWRQRGIDAYDQENNFGSRFMGQMAGGFALPTRVPQAFMRGGAQAGARQMGIEGAGFGGLYGAGSSEGDLADRFVEGAVSVPLGGATGYGAGRVLGRFARPPETAPRRQEQIDTARAAEALGIDLPRFVAGGPTAQRMASSVEQTPFGAAPISEGTDRLLAQSREALDRIAGRNGTRLEPEGAGAAAQAGGRAYDDQAGRRIEAMYDRAEQLSGDTRVPLPSAAASLDQQIAELADTPGVVPTMLEPLRAIRGRIDGEWTPASIRRMRTQLRNQFVEAGMQQSDASRRASLVTRAAEEDMIAGLRQRGMGDAAAAWQEASAGYAQHQDTLSDTIIPMIGDDGAFSASRVARNLVNASRGEGERLARFLDTVPPEQAGEIRSTLIGELGRANSGAQDAAGEAFSLDTFLTNWDKIRGSRDLIFDQETRNGLNNLAMVATAARNAGRSRNRSNTGGNVWAAATFLPAAGGVGAGYATGDSATTTGSIIGFGLMALGQRGAGRLLASPKFAQRLARTPASPRDAARYWSQPWVSQMARQNPAIANDLMQVQQRIVAAANDNAGQMTQIAASPGDDEEQRQGQRRDQR